MSILLFAQHHLISMLCRIKVQPFVNYKFLRYVFIYIRKYVNIQHIDMYIPTSINFNYSNTCKEIHNYLQDTAIRYSLWVSVCVCGCVYANLLFSCRTNTCNFLLFSSLLYYYFGEYIAYWSAVWHFLRFRPSVTDRIHTYVVYIIYHELIKVIT